MGRELKPGSGIVIGVTKFAWMFDMSRDWAERVFRDWWTEQQMGGPTRVFKMGRRGSLFTTMPIVHQYMPPGRDIALYKRVEAVEQDVSDAHQRIDREVAERTRADQDLQRRVSSLEARRGAQRDTRRPISPADCALTPSDLEFCKQNGFDPETFLKMRIKELCGDLPQAPR